MLSSPASPIAPSSTTTTLISSDHTHRTLRSQLDAVWQRRDLLANLTKREVKARHKNSVIGFAWNLLNPLLQMVVYTVVFTYFMPGRTPLFPIKLLSAMAVFGLFSTSLNAAATSVSGNSALVLKIWFPREILPLSAVASNLVTFLSRVSILVIGLVAYWHPPAWSMLWLAALAVFVTLVLATGLGLLLATANVFFRDTQHFLDLVLMALFWFTPVIWNYDYLAARIIDHFGPEWERIVLLNPLIPIVTTFQRVLHNPAALPLEDQGEFTLMLRPNSWYLTNLGIAFVVSAITLVVGLRVFRRYEGAFAESL